MTLELDSNAEVVGTLLRLAGTREQPPDGAYERVWPAVEAAWHDKLAHRRRQRATRWLAAAAVVVASVAAVVGLRSSMEPSLQVARLDRTIGSLEIRSPGAETWIATGIAAGRELAAGTRLRTSAAGRAGLLLDAAVSLRVAGSSEIELSGPRDIRLLQGVVYVDTGPGGAGGQIRLVTDSSTFQDFGTQFEVSYVEGELRLRVREGQVVMGRDTERHVAYAGQQIAVDPQGRMAREDFSGSDPAWRWIESVAPASSTDGQPVTALLGWVSRETGRKLRYDDPAVEQLAAATILHGRLSELTPLETLDVLLATTDLEYRLGQDEAIEVSRRQD
jgi:hypothetical protein